LKSEEDYPFDNPELKLDPENQPGIACLFAFHDYFWEF